MSGISHFDAVHLDNIFIFLGPSLEEFTLKCFDDGDWDGGYMAIDDDEPKKGWEWPISRLLETLPVKCLHLCKFRLQTKIDSSSIHLQSMIRLVTLLPRLAYFESDLITLHPTLLDCLAGHPSLQELHIGYFVFTTLDERSVPFYTLPTNSFPSLRSLHVFLSEDIARAILKLVPPRLDELVFHVTNDPVPYHREVLAHIVHQIAINQPHLRKIDLQIREYESGFPTPMDSDSSVVWTPLLQNSFLSSFGLDWWPEQSLDIRDPHILSMAQAWPRLKQFKLCSHGWAGRKISGLRNNHDMTLAAVASLAQYCPDLEMVEFSFLDLTVVPDPPRIEPSQHALKFTLHMNQKEFEAETVAQFLFSLWPKIEVSGDILGRKAAEYASWKSVAMMLDAMQLDSG